MLPVENTVQPLYALIVFGLIAVNVAVFRLMTRKRNGPGFKDVFLRLFIQYCTTAVLLAAVMIMADPGQMSGLEIFLGAFKLGFTGALLFLLPFLPLLLLLSWFFSRKKNNRPL